MVAESPKVKEVVAGIAKEGAVVKVAREEAVKVAVPERVVVVLYKVVVAPKLILWFAPES